MLPVVMFSVVTCSAPAIGGISKGRQQQWDVIAPCRVVHPEGHCHFRVEVFLSVGLEIRSGVESQGVVTGGQATGSKFGDAAVGVGLRSGDGGAVSITKFDANPRRGVARRRVENVRAEGLAHAVPPASASIRRASLIRLMAANSVRSMERSVAGAFRGGPRRMSRSSVPNFPDAQTR